jgi:hypothetical protein
MPVTGSTISHGVRALATLLMTSLLVLYGSPRPIDDASAQGDGTPLSARDFAPYLPIAQYLSSASWLLVTGQDPRLLGASPKSEPGQADEAMLPERTRTQGSFFSRNLLASRAVGPISLTSEPRIVADPLDPKHLVLAAIDYNLPSIVTYVTHDGGESWDGPHQVRVFAPDLLAGGAPDLTFGSDGKLFLVATSIGLDDIQLGSFISSVVTQHLVVSRSDDGGSSWSDAAVAAASSIDVTPFPDEAGVEQTGVTYKFLDSPSIAVGPDPDDPDRDLLYVAYTDFDVHASTVSPGDPPVFTTVGSESTIRLVRSPDGGQSWSDPINVSPTMAQTRVTFATGAMPAIGNGPGSTSTATGRMAPPPNVTDRGEDLPEDVVQGADAAVAADGTLVIAFLDTTFDGPHQGLGMVIVAASHDGGLSFGQPVQAGIFREIGETPRTANFRTWSGSFPQLAVGMEDEIYVAVTARPENRPTDDGDVLLLRSVDQGETWEAPLRLNHDEGDHVQFFPALAVGPDGVVHASWGDMRDDPTEVRYEIYYSESSDQGATWHVQNAPEDVRATDFAANSLVGFAGGRFLGDHFSLAAPAGDVYLAWSDTRLGEPRAPSQQIGFARTESLTSPKLLVSPSSGDAGSAITLQGSGFQQWMPVDVTVEGVTVATVVSEADGTFETAVLLPFSGAGPLEISAVDETGNRASVSFTVDQRP